MSADKRVDEDWKDRVEREKSGQPAPAGPSRGGPAPAQPRPAPAPEPESEEGLPPKQDFRLFLSSLSMQAMVALGELPHPATQQAQEDLEQARYLVDVLGMLQQKTRGNLSAEEGSLLEGLLYELRTKYVSKMRG